MQGAINKARLVFEGRSHSLLFQQAGHLMVSYWGFRVLGDSVKFPLRHSPYEIRPSLEVERGFNASGNKPSQMMPATKCRAAFGFLEQVSLLLGHVQKCRRTQESAFQLSPHHLDRGLPGTCLSL